jgi:hypothetical protein
MIMASVRTLCICPELGQPMQYVSKVKVLAGVGIEGDRYATGKGTYSGRPNRSDRSKSMRQVSLISLGAFWLANNKLDVPFEICETRRNIGIVGKIDLLSLIGKEFKIGDVPFRGFEDCTPCTLPEQMAKKTGFMQAFKACGGLRAEILADGIIFIGDPLEIT